MSDQIEASNNKRLMFMVILSVIGVSVIIMLFMFGKDDDTSPSGVSQAPAISSTPGGDNESQVYGEFVQRNNEQVYEQSMSSGESAVTTISTSPAQAGINIDSIMAGSTSSASPVPDVQDEEEVVREVLSSPQEVDALPLANPAMQAEMDLWLGKWALPAQAVVFTAAPHLNEEGDKIERQGAIAVQPPGKDVIIQAGSSVYAVLELAVNTDYPGPVGAMVIGGKHDGARLIGGFNRAHDRVVLQFNTLALPSGSTLSIEAVAVDAKGESFPAVAGKVNRHIFTNHILPAAARFISAFGEASTRGRESVTVGPLTLVTSEEELSTKEKLTAAAGEVGAGIIQDIAGQRREITVALPAAQPLIVYFLADVVEISTSPSTHLSRGENYEN